MTPEEIVTAFIGLKAVSKASLYEAFDVYFSEVTIWENIGLSRSQGVEEAKHVLKNAENMGVETIRVEILHQCSKGNLVVNERVDHIMDKGGKELLALRAMGIFEVINGKITSWRDYCDISALRLPTQGVENPMDQPRDPE